MTLTKPHKTYQTPARKSSAEPGKRGPVRQFSCSYCDRNFSRGDNLKRHEDTFCKASRAIEARLARKELQLRLREVESPRQVHIGNNTSTTNNTKNNNTRVPKPLRKQVWLKRNGNVIEGKCYVCIGAISYDTFESGHVKAASTGGETTLQNLEPICKTCNNDMGIEDLEQFKKVWYQQHDQYKSSGIQGH